MAEGLKDFLNRIGFKPHGTITNSWDSFNDAGAALMQLWSEPDQRVRGHAIAGAYLRVRCWNAAHNARDATTKKVGYAGRERALLAFASGKKTYAMVSAPSSGQHTAGEWVKNADLTKAYPVLSVEDDPASGDRFVVLGEPIATVDMH